METFWYRLTQPTRSTCKMAEHTSPSGAKNSASTFPKGNPLEPYGVSRLTWSNLWKLPHAGSGVVRIDPLRFLAGCRIQGD